MSLNLNNKIKDAILCKDLVRLADLIDRCEDIDCLIDDLQTPLTFSIKMNYVEATILLLNRRANPDKILYSPNNSFEHMFESNCALFEAIELNCVDFVQLLLEYNADINITTRFGETPLRTAVSNENHEISKVLLENGANIISGWAIGNKGINRLDDSALSLACECGYLAIAELLVEYGANVNFFGTNAWNPLMFAVEKGHLNIVEYLFYKGAELDRRVFSLIIEDINNFSALILSIRNEHTHIAEFLIESGANINIDDSDGNTALLHAIKKKQNKIIELLLKNSSVNVFHNNRKGFDALLFAINSENIDLIQRLLSKYPNFAEKMYVIENPIHLACNKGNVDIVEMLYKKGFDLLIENLRKDTIIEIAITNSEHDLTAYLLEKTVIYEYVIKNYQTLFLLSIKFNSNNLFDFILNNNCDINYILDDSTPLLFAIGWDRFEFAKELVNRGAEKSYVNEAGISILETALSSKNKAFKTLF